MALQFDQSKSKKELGMHLQTAATVCKEKRDLDRLHVQTLTFPREYKKTEVTKTFRKHSDKAVFPNKDNCNRISNDYNGKEWRC